MARTLNIPGVEVNIPTYEELLASLPEKFHTDKVKEQLKNAWEWENKIMREEVQRLEEAHCKGSARMFLFSNAGCQWIADFWVKNLGKEETGSYNWHGQNTSQWTYAGGIVFSERSFENNSDYMVSRHH